MFCSQLHNACLLFQAIRSNLTILTRHFKILETTKHSNILILSIPFRYGLQNCTVVNRKIPQLNKKLHKLARVIPYSNFFDSFNDSKLFTSHGLHRNNLGRKLNYSNYELYYIFQSKILSPLPPGWYELTEELKLHTETSQTKISTRNCSRLRKNQSPDQMIFYGKLKHLLYC